MIMLMGITFIELMIPPPHIQCRWDCDFSYVGAFEDRGDDEPRFVTDTVAHCYEVVSNKKHTIHWEGMELDNLKVNKLRNKHA